MTSTILENEKEPEKKWPRLMESYDGQVVLIVSVDNGVGTGIGLADKGSNLSYGSFFSMDNDWDMHYFTDFHGTIQLRND